MRRQDDCHFNSDTKVVCFWIQVPKKHSTEVVNGREGDPANTVVEKPLEEMTKLELLQLIKEGNIIGVSKKRQKTSDAKHNDPTRRDPFEHAGRYCRHFPDLLSYACYLPEYFAHLPITGDA